jgi:uncharacterized protein YciI
MRRVLYFYSFKRIKMKGTIIALLLSVIAMAAIAQSDNPKYDKALAESLGGDDYGMKPYVLVMLKTGSNTTTDKKVIDSLFASHMANIQRLADEEKLVVAGPLKKNDRSYRGIFIFNVKTIEDANALLVTDPAIKAKLLDAELYQWYGSAALPVYLQTHEKIEKKKM